MKISRLLQELHDEISNVPNARFKSWEHCYKAFTNDRSNVDYDQLSLHLFAYLASWGMLRGSSFLLQRDYQFHNEIVKEIMKKKYDCLVGINPKHVDDYKLKLIIELKDNIKEIYESKIENTELVQKNVTDTLTTKIMLGTLGCIPAFDRFFINGMKKENLSPRTTVNRKSIRALIAFYDSHIETFQKSENDISLKSSVRYPPMKVLDMYLWKLGFE